jgi:hypothetical protein
MQGPTAPYTTSGTVSFDSPKLILHAFYRVSPPLRGIDTYCND